MKIKSVAKGFTLIELLVVVLIIGILSAVALPMYRKAVEKSRVTDALNTMQAVAKSEHGWYLTNNNYTKDFGNLDIDLIDEEGERAEGESYDTINYTFTLQDNSIMAQRSNGEYTLYKMYEDPNIYCLPQDHYICQQFGWGVNRGLCDSINGAWSNIKGQCYGSSQERCAAHDMPYKNGFCGWNSSGDSTGVTINEGGICQGGRANNPYCAGVTIKSGGACYGFLGGNCDGVTVETGGKCETSYVACRGNYYGGTCVGNGWYACSGYWGGESSNFYDGSTCIGNSSSACSSTSNHGGKTYFKSGSKCIANVSNTCNANYESGSCCQNKEGTNNCPANAPKCHCPNGDGTYATSC